MSITPDYGWQTDELSKVIGEWDAKVPASDDATALLIVLQELAARIRALLKDADRSALAQDRTPTSEPCLHLRQWIIPTRQEGTGWCFRCGAINLTGEWTQPDWGGNGKATGGAQ